jgi:L-amino acid N-acyltransferase YncA
MPAMAATPETGPRLVIRPARGEDAAALREIFNQAIQDGLETFETEPRTLEDQRVLIEAANQDAKHPILVAELRGWALGWITIQPHDPRPGLDGVGEITVYVQRSFRNYGVGRQLMKMIQKEAQRVGYRKLVGWVLAENRDSLRLCHSTGWREVGKHQKHAHREDTFRDVVLVEYLIPSPPTA